MNSIAKVYEITPKIITIVTTLQDNKCNCHDLGYFYQYEWCDHHNPESPKFVSRKFLFGLSGFSFENQNRLKYWCNCLSLPKKPIFLQKNIHKFVCFQTPENL